MKYIYPIIFISIFILLTSFTCETKLSNDNIASIVKINENNPYLKNKENLDILLLKHAKDSSFKEVNDYGELLIGNFLEKHEKFAILAYQTSDSTMKILVLNIENSKVDTILQFQNESYFEEPLGKEIIELRDFNGDNQLDLKIIFSFWHTHYGENSLLWLYNDRKFKKVKDFEQIISADYDKKTNQIFSYQSDGCGDMNMEFFVFKIVRDEVIQTDEIYCECCDCNSGYCTVRKKDDTTNVSINSLHLIIPDFYKEMIEYKMKYCKKE